MMPSPSLEEQLRRARRHWSHQVATTEQPSAPPTDHPFSIAVSREEGSLGSEVALQLGQHLDWPVYDQQLLDQISEKSGLRTELLASVDERETHWIVDSIGAFAHHAHVSSAAYVHHLAKVLAALSAYGRCIILGRGAVAVLPADRTLRVRIVASSRDRVCRLQDELQITERKAQRHLSKKDTDRRQFVKNHFQKDISDPHLYDIVLNTSRISPRSCARLIEEALKLRQRVVEPVR